MQELTVVNDMLGTMGETPLASLEEPHTFRGACLSILDTYNRRIQSKGWWFNKETLKLSPNADGGLYVPGDCINVQTDDGTLVLRGRRLYDKENGTYTIGKEKTVVIVRLIPFADLPESAAAYIAASAILRFQSRYDGDTAKTRELTLDLNSATVGINTENTRESNINFIQSNSSLMRLKSRTLSARRI